MYHFKIDFSKGGIEFQKKTKLEERMANRNLFSQTNAKKGTSGYKNVRVNFREEGRKEINSRCRDISGKVS